MTFFENSSRYLEMANQYLYNSKADLTILRSQKVDLKNMASALRRFDHTIAQIANFEVDIFTILGMRNLSAFVGEVFAASMIHHSDGLFIKNPHQDGYPDLLLNDALGKRLLEKLKDNLRDKNPFSPFQGGGIEIKATCGSVPTPAICQKRGFQKPDIGDERVTLLTGYDWKAHHRDTNFLMGILWDFKNRKPTICAVFYCNTLDTNDWGKIIKPKDGGGRTTSVSIMTRDGVKKMYDHWIAVLKDDRYIDFLNRYNKSNSI